MKVELVLILGLYAFLLLGAFMGDNGPIGVFRRSTPRLAAMVERNTAIGNKFIINGSPARWERSP